MLGPRRLSSWARRRSSSLRYGVGVTLCARVRVQIVDAMRSSRGAFFERPDYCVDVTVCVVARGRVQIIAIELQ